jgi:hypothetical protein
MAVFEVLQVTRPLRELLVDGRDDTAIARAARARAWRPCASRR